MTTLARGWPETAFVISVIINQSFCINQEEVEAPSADPNSILDGIKHGTMTQFNWFWFFEASEVDNLDLTAFPEVFITGYSYGVVRGMCDGPRLSD